MKFEKIVEKNLFKKELIGHLIPVSSLCQQFKYAYSSDGNKLQVKTITPQYLLKHKIDLFLSETAWDKYEVTKPKQH